MDTSRKRVKNTTKEELLELKDLSCPVCIDILIEPVRLPCQHLLCLDCYRKTTDLTAFNCPVCRERISNWDRTAAKNKSWVDEQLWNRMKVQFHREIQRKQESNRNMASLSSCGTSPSVKLAKPGEIHAEYLAELRKTSTERMSDWNGNLILTSVDDDCSSSSHKGKENELPTNKRRSRNSSTETLKSPLKTEVKWERLPAQPALISCVILQNPSVSATQRYSLRSTSAESPVQVGYQRPDIQHSLSPNGRQPRGQKRKAAEMTGGGDADQLADPSPLEDFQVALQLQKLYDLESSYGRVEVRIPGSGNEFNLRNKRGRSSKRSE